MRSVIGAAARLVLNGVAAVAVIATAGSCWIGDISGDHIDGGGADVDAAPADANLGESCNFDYDSSFVYPSRRGSLSVAAPATDLDGWPHPEPAPPSYSLMRIAGAAADLVMPDYADDMPLFERGQAWTASTRCYETPNGVRELSEAEAFDLYRSIAEKTTGVAFDATAEVRSVVGLRGAYPGTFAWHENRADRFNDTIALLWIDLDGTKHVREFPINTDTGAYDFGTDSSSSLRPNRRYRYSNGWHRGYNALSISETGYRVRDDTNNNGHWDSDRNGWLPPDTGQDRDRAGSAHNIHMGSRNAPLGGAVVGVWSAGCQVIPGMANWTEFIGNAWTDLGDSLDYFLVDVRDIAPDVWNPCEPDGTHACPFRIDELPFDDSADTSAVTTAEFDLYNCSDADESGPEISYLFTTDRSGTIEVTVAAAAPIDPDIHLLDGDDHRACLARGDATFDYDLTPGRYFIVVDTYESDSHAGAYTLQVRWK